MGKNNGNFWKQVWYPKDPLTKFHIDNYPVSFVQPFQMMVKIGKTASVSTQHLLVGQIPCLPLGILISTRRQAHQEERK